jgi:hypothetical protein
MILGIIESVSKTGGTIGSVIVGVIAAIIIIAILVLLER